MNCMQFNETDQQVKLEFKDVSYFSSGEGGNVSAAIAEHNSATDAHNDIRLLIQGLSERLSALADSDDTTLDQLSEIVAYIKSNRDLISAITADKVSSFISVELSMGQMVEDIELAIRCKKPVELCNRVGGMIPSPEEVLAKIKEANGGNN